MKKAILLLLLVLPMMSYAHPGHDFFNGFSLQHYLTSPQHVFSIAAVLIPGIIVYRMIRKRKKKHI